MQKYLSSVISGNICYIAVIWEIKAVHDELVPGRISACLW